MEAHLCHSLTCGQGRATGRVEATPLRGRRFVGLLGHGTYFLEVSVRMNEMRREQADTQFFISKPTVSAQLICSCIQLQLLVAAASYGPNE